MTSPPTSSWARTSCPIETSIISSRVARFSSPTMCPSYPITPRTTSPAARARSASRPASSGVHPQRGSPTFTSMSTSATPPRAAASIVASESTATVTRAPRLANAPSRLASTTSLASSKSSPRPASAMPSISRMVAQVNAVLPECGLARRQCGALVRLDVGTQPSSRQRLGHRAQVCVERGGFDHQRGRRQLRESSRPLRLASRLRPGPAVARALGYCPPS